MITLSIHHIDEIIATPYASGATYWVSVCFRTAPGRFSGTRNEQTIALFFNDRAAAERCALALNSVFDKHNSDSTEAQLAAAESMP
jgi:hypothetical protein